MPIANVHSAKGRMGRRLREAIEHLRNDIDRVEFWAEILDELEQPIPSYDNGTSNLNRFNLAAGHDGSTGGRASDDKIRCSNQAKKQPVG
jgi:hypothetical protein